MAWNRHDGRGDGTDNWTGPKQVGGGMDRYQSVFPGGEGIIYGINPDGTLDRYRHDGRGEGLAGHWTTVKGMASGWNTHLHVIGAPA
jgi:Tachylectin